MRKKIFKTICSGPAAASGWSLFDPQAHGAETPFMVRDGNGNSIKVVQNQFGQILDFTTRRPVMFVPEESSHLTVEGEFSVVVVDALMVETPVEASVESSVIKE